VSTNYGSYDWTYSTPYAILPPGDRIMIEQQDFDELPEYSCSKPTGVYYGKMWKSDANFNRRRYGLQLFPNSERWTIHQYLPHDTDPHLCKIMEFRPVIVKRLKMPTHCGGKRLLMAPKTAYGPSRLERILSLVNAGVLTGPEIREFLFSRV
jgi:hypothetical protein